MPLAAAVVAIAVDFQIQWEHRALHSPMTKRSMRLKVASPCRASWDDMRGDDAIRHCSQCDKDVYHLSHMTSEQLEALLARQDETPCVRFHHRADGTVITGDCPVGARSARRKRLLLGVGAGVSAGMAVAFGYQQAASVNTYTCIMPPPKEMEAPLAQDEAAKLAHHPRLEEDQSARFSTTMGEMVLPEIDELEAEQPDLEE